MNLLDRNSQSLDDAAAAYNDRILAPTPSPTTGFYLGCEFSADNRTKRHKVQTLNGDIFYGHFISTGAAGIGDKVSIILTRGGLPQFDTMPR